MWIKSKSLALIRINIYLVFGWWWYIPRAGVSNLLAYTGRIWWINKCFGPHIKYTNTNESENPVTGLDCSLEWVHPSAGSHYSSGIPAPVSVTGLECYWNNVNRALQSSIATSYLLNLFLNTWKEKKGLKGWETY